MARRNRRIVIIGTVVLGLSLAGAWLALRHNPEIQAPVHATSNMPFDTRITSEASAVLRRNAELPADHGEAEPSTGTRVPGNAADVAGAVKRIDLRQLFQNITGRIFPYDAMTDEQLLELSGQLRARANTGDLAAALEAAALTVGLCELPLSGPGGWLGSGEDMHAELLARLRPDETQFDAQFLSDYAAAYRRHSSALEPQCRERAITGLENDKQLREMFRATGSVLGFLLNNDGITFEQMQLLNAADRQEIMQMSPSIRANLASEMLTSLESEGPCEHWKSVWQYVADGADPEILLVQAGFSRLECEQSPLLAKSPLELIQAAAAFGTSMAISRYLYEHSRSDPDTHAIEQAAWLEFQEQLARDYCYGRQSFQILTRLYRQPQHQIAGLSAREAATARARSVQLADDYGAQARRYLGCHPGSGGN